VFKDNFNYSILGSETGEKIVFLHGLMAFSANWRKIASRLENEFQCLIYDQRGHGRSFKPEDGSGNYSLETFAEDLNKITTELGWKKFHLVGHSMGARVAMVFAHLYPERVKTLTLEDMGPDADGKALYYQDMLESIPTPFATKVEVKNFFDQEFFKKFTPKESQKVLSTFLQANLEEKANGVYDWRFSKKAIYEIARESQLKELWAEVSSFKMPVLLIRGENSHILKQETYEKMLKVNPQITGGVFKDASHWVHFEKYEEFVSELHKFVQLHNA
jgi:esterase